MCHTAEDCLHSCAGGRRRRSGESVVTDDEVEFQANGLPRVNVISRELLVTSESIDGDETDELKMKRVVGRVTSGLASMQKNFKATRKAINFLEKIINGEA